MVMAFGYAQAVAGNGSEAHAALHRLKAIQRQRYVPALYFAGIYVGLGDHGAAMKCLNEAYQERNDRMIYLPIEPVVNPLRSDPAFQALLDKVAAANTDCIHENMRNLAPVGRNIERETIAESHPLNQEGSPRSIS